MSKKKNRERKKTRAQQADRHDLYERSVQCVEAEIDFVDETFRKIRGRRAATLREDFCGTANTSCEWVRRRPGNVAWAVDLDPEVLEWGRSHKLSELKPKQAARVHLVNGNVLSSPCEPVDITLAMNFSYWIFKKREDMKQYFRTVHGGLVDDGVFMLDAFGGYEAFQEMEESTKFKRFTYVWDQDRYNPVTGEILCHIHFRFKDGSAIRNAFTYDWRLWTLPELTGMLEASGFAPTVYWEGTDKNGEGNGVFTPTTTGEADAGWIAYIIAEKR